MNFKLKLKIFYACLFILQFCIYLFFLQPSIMNQFSKPEMINPLYNTDDELDDENNEVYIY